MSHGDKVTEMPPGFKLMASARKLPWMAGAWLTKRGVSTADQFHPEVTHTSRAARF